MPLLRIAARLVLALCVSGVLPPALASTASAVHAGITSSGNTHAADAPAVPPHILARAASRPMATRKAPDASAALPTVAAAAVPRSDSAHQAAAILGVSSGARLPILVRGPPSLI